MKKILEILIVEDDATDKELLERFFREERIFNSIAWCKDAASTMDYLKTNAPDMIFLDMFLGDSTAIDLMARADFPKKPISVILSGANGEGIKALAEHAGVDYWIEKPLTRANLISLMSKIEALGFALVA